MRSSENVFHLAIPCADLAAAEAFYVDQLGCRKAREYADRITLDFFGDQVVCHLSPDAIDADPPEMYPRHFGVTFRHKEHFDALWERARARDIRVFKGRFVRFPGAPAEHETFFLQDPSNNLLEFKYCADPAMMY